MCIRLSNVEESINDQHSIINEIERELSVVADKLKKLSSESSASLSSHSGADKLHKSTQTDQNCSSSSSHHMSPRSSSSHPDPIVSHPSRTTVSYKSFPPYKISTLPCFCPFSPCCRPLAFRPLYPTHHSLTHLYPSPSYCPSRPFFL